MLVITQPYGQLWNTLEVKMFIARRTLVLAITDRLSALVVSVLEGDGLPVGEELVLSRFKDEVRVWDKTRV